VFCGISHSVTTTSISPSSLNLWPSRFYFRDGG
jgi:hypothetical protein